ncbi:hypothetical protein KIN20_004821 [Parelaphostrongylus tenuis]|uniref:Uncharacterized protein n=1 Tax=Parelaphostrongylus tenuis TaxID=148309 RepID=A0AAD5LZ46_PARTN|nr:hypothetical protein KIN20_004821 [Parelaphostrongylus tenuis]
MTLQIFKFRGKLSVEQERHPNIRVRHRYTPRGLTGTFTQTSGSSESITLHEQLHCHSIIHRDPLNCLITDLSASLSLVYTVKVISSYMQVEQ